MPLSSLMSLHPELEELFLLHQEALVERRFELASELLDAYERLLRTHMRHEEERILPIFDRAGPVPRWPRVLYTGQHDKMLSLLESIRSALKELRWATTELRRGAIALLGFEATYKHLLEHHDGAEAQGLYPVVDRTASPEEQERVLAACLKEWQAALETEAPLIERARRALGPDGCQPASPP
jgi:hemerythrin-like domain-containing protein